VYSAKKSISVAAVLLSSRGGATEDLAQRDAGGEDHGKIIGKRRTNIREEAGKRSGKKGWKGGIDMVFLNLENDEATIAWELYDRNSMGKYGKQVYK
jgi:hypothetical protein